MEKTGGRYGRKIWGGRSRRKIREEDPGERYGRKIQEEDTRGRYGEGDMGRKIWGGRYGEEDMGRKIQEDDPGG